MNNNWIWLVLSAAIGSLSVMIGYLFVPLLIDGQIIRADILGSLGTWAGSIATVGTLVFLIRQNIELSKRQDKQQEQQEQQQKQQDEIWAEQKEMLHFQKYQEHKKAFFSHLSYIEKISRIQVNFQYKSSLYDKLFPLNNFEHCKCHIENIEEHNYIQRILQLVESIDTNFHSDNINSRDLFEDIHHLVSELGLSIGTLQAGSIKISDRANIDFFEPYENINSIKHIIIELIIFTKASIPEPLRIKSKMIRMQWAKLQIELLAPLTSARITNFTLEEIDNSDDKLFILFLASAYLEAIKDCSTEQLSLLNVLFSITYDRNSYNHFVLQPTNLTKLFERIYNEFHILSNKANNDKDKENYFTLSKAARFSMNGKMVKWSELPKNKEESVDHYLDTGYF